MRALRPILFYVAILLASCGKSTGTLPASSNKPYEMLIVGDKEGILCQQFEKPMNGLPQSEPLFDISQTDSANFSGIERLARNIIVLKIDNRYKNIDIKAEQNVYAQHQVILFITARSKNQLARFLGSTGQRLVNYFTKIELRREQHLLQLTHNTEAEKKIKQMFGAQMLVPADMLASKQGRNFLWLSNNANTSMASICLYTINTADFKEQRDSIMQRNIPGEWKGSFMQTTRIDEVVVSKRGAKTVRGLWEMNSDAMGGPFVAYIPSPGSRSILVAEAFVFAPESKKRNIVRRLEAAIYTLKQSTKHDTK